MIAELGHGSLILSIVLSLTSAFGSAFAIYKVDSYWASCSRLLSYLACVCVTFSVIFLAICFVIDDFSVLYVASHSNTHLPFIYKLTAVWGGHEGSFLFWLFCLIGWTALVAKLGKTKNQEFQNWTLIILTTISTAIGGYILFASNPFIRLLPAAFEGRDLNPMLQDIGLIVHPPLLYLGYVGFAVAFAMSMATMITKENNPKWAEDIRPWALSSWCFMTAGIVLGAWWAYNELGWGGWWFWDPVENASLMPWLTATALLHSLKVSKQPNIMSGWSLLLATFTFCLSILGTFIVRSGVITSVHAFATDPTRGIILLSILSVVMIGSMLVFAYRAGRYIQPMKFEWLSLPMLFFLGNGLFCIATFSVLLGTLYPMVYQLFGLGNISVGAPYFNQIFVPIVLLLCILMGLSSFIHVHRVNVAIPYFHLVKRPLIISISIALLVAGIGTFKAYRTEFQWFEGSYSIIVIASVLSCWVIVASIMSAIKDNKKIAMACAHIGVALIVIAASYEGYASVETSQKVTNGTQFNFHDHRFEYEKTELLIGPNYTAERGVIRMSDEQGQLVNYLKPEKRHYTVRSMDMTEPDVYWNRWGDWYITLGDKIDNDHYAIRLQYKPLMRWIWYGGGLMVFGALITLVFGRARSKLSLNIKEQKGRWCVE
ncbi:heme lyase CcmF/NrfE family subunit [Vibrio algivorus]|uniref:Heme lyase CcmF/NrfE family subunit n=1 Tax=Vibrio algivorus TaxID=1667024 RepID=A0A557P8G7_9VIBR|nr:heme lyase CcmF/NrfE family subunit [Vibrio algivorus]TVO36960.1 heme lyase CcmF/NrfE family subunit [Vibrio algivorus]